MNQYQPSPPRTRHIWRTLLFFLPLLILTVSVGGPHSVAQRKQDERAGSQPGPKKNLTPLKGSESSSGSRVTVTSDVPLNDYSAYRSGDRFYVVIPESGIPNGQGGLKGRGFEDVQVQKRGNDTVVSFKLQPGASARVNQKFNKLDIEINAPAGLPVGTTLTPSGDQGSNLQATSPRIDTRWPSRGTHSSGSSAAASGGSAAPSLESTSGSSSEFGDTQQGRQAGNTSEVNQPGGETPANSQPVAPGTSGSQPVASPVSEQRQSSLGLPKETAASRFIVANWKWLASGAAVLLLPLIAIVLRRRRAVDHPSEDQGAAPAEEVSPSTEETDKAEVAAADANVFTPRVEPPAPVIAPAPQLATPSSGEASGSESASALPSESIGLGGTRLNPEPSQAKPVGSIGPIGSVNLKVVETEASRVLRGEKYDLEVIDSRDPGTRQFVATELLSAAGARNATRRAHAVKAFVEHGYFDEATRVLRTAEAPAERASAARALGMIRDTNATPHLIAALEDPSADVRRASVEAIAELRDSSATGALEELLQRERDRKVPRALIQRAIDASATPPEPIDTTQPAATATLANTPEEIPNQLSERATDELGLEPIISDTKAIVPVNSELQTGAGQFPSLEDVLNLPSTEPRAIAPKAKSTAPGRAADGSPELALPDIFELPGLETTPALNEVLTGESDSNIELVDETNTELVDEPETSATGSVIFHEFGAGNAVDSKVAIERNGHAPTVQAPAEIEQVKEIELNTSTEAATADAFPGDEYAFMSLLDVPLVSASDVINHSAPPAIQKTSEGCTGIESEKTGAGSGAEAQAEPRLETGLVHSPSEPLNLPVETTGRADATSTELELHEAASEPTTEPERIIADEKSVVLATTAVNENPAKGSDPEDRAKRLIDLAADRGEEAFSDICLGFDDPDVEVRNAAAHALYSIKGDRAASFTRALRESPVDRRKRIGNALATSGLANEAIGHLMGEGREKTYDAFSLLFLMSKAGEVQPLLRAIEDHPSVEVRLAVVKLLALSGQQEILPFFRRLAVRGSLPPEVRSAVMEAIYQVSNQAAADAHSV